LQALFRQACVDFQIVDSYTVTNILWDGVCTMGCSVDGKAQANEHIDTVYPDRSWTGPIQLFLYRNSGIPGKGGWTPDGRIYSMVFTFDVAGSVHMVAAHEVGHQLWLSTRNADGEFHDYGPAPAGTGCLMDPSAQGVWLRREDWFEANETAQSK
jgi:hypothetical protein